MGAACGQCSDRVDNSDAVFKNLPVKPAATGKEERPMMTSYPSVSSDPSIVEVGGEVYTVDDDEVVSPISPISPMSPLRKKQKLELLKIAKHTPISKEKRWNAPVHRPAPILAAPPPARQAANRSNASAPEPAATAEDESARAAEPEFLEPVKEEGPREDVVMCTRSDTSTPSVTKQHSADTTFSSEGCLSVSLQRSGAFSKLGLDCKEVDGGLEVIRIVPDGEVAHWNTKHDEEEQVHTGDQIVCVNGAFGLSTHLLQRMLMDSSVDILIRRSPNTPPATPTVVEFLN